MNCVQCVDLDECINIKGRIIGTVTLSNIFAEYKSVDFSILNFPFFQRLYRIVHIYIYKGVNK